MNNSEQKFLKELDVKLWSAADRLRNNLDAANYKHVVLGIIFLKYVSDAFEERQQELRTLFTEDSSDDNIYYMPREDYDSEEEYNEAVNAELELHEYYQEKNIFWVPKQSRWEFLKSTAARSIGDDVELENGETFKLTSISKLIDNALDAIETYKIDDQLANPKLKGVLPRVGRYEVDNHNLTELINKFSDTSFRNPEYNGEKLDLHSKDILGHVYEYFLGQFALAEGKQGGREAELGLNPDEIAFYDALANNESAVRELGDEILKKIAVEITDKLRKSTTVDWQVRAVFALS